MYWHNGQLIQTNTLEISINDPGLLYGATVFTTLRVYHKSLDHPLTNWNNHLQRLQTSLETFAWKQPDWNRVKQGAQTMQKQNWPVLRIALFPDGRELITPRTLPPDLPQRQQTGISAWLAETDQHNQNQLEYLEYRRILAHHKTGNYLPAWLALQKAQQQGIPEAILTDTNGKWLETSTGNLWGWKAGAWHTPPNNSNILPGLAAQQLIHWLTQQKQPIIQQPWTHQTASQFETLAYSNSVVEIIPIHTVITSSGTHTYNPHHPALKQLRQLYSITNIS